MKEIGSFCRHRGTDYVQQKNLCNQTIKPAKARRTLLFGSFDSFVMAPMVPAERPRKYSPLIFDNLYSRQFTSFTSEKHTLRWSAMSKVHCKEINERERVDSSTAVDQKF